MRIIIKAKLPSSGARFSVRGSNQRQAIEGPWQTQPKMAVLSPWFRVNRSARVFPEVSLEILVRFRPGVIAGPVAALRELARLVLQEASAVPLPDFGILAFTGPALEPLTDDDRDLFWRAFQVPVFEQYRDQRGELVAAECEAHQGLHLLARDTPIDLDDVKIVKGLCSCGMKSPRIEPARAVPLVNAVARSPVV